MRKDGGGNKTTKTITTYKKTGTGRAARFVPVGTAQKTTTRKTYATKEQVAGKVTKSGTGRAARYGKKM